MEHYVQTASTGATGGRPVTSIGRALERQLASLTTATPDRPMSRQEALRVLEEVRTSIGLDLGAFATLRHLVLLTKKQDWEDQNLTRVWPSDRKLAEMGGVTVGAIKKRLRKLRALGLVASFDSANYRRFGERDGRSGLIISGFGLDLAPIQMRRDELRGLAEQASIATKTFAMGARRIGRMHRLLSQLLAQAAERGMIGPQWLELTAAASEVDCDCKIARRARDVDAFSRALERITTIEGIAASLADRYLLDDGSDPQGLPEGPHIHIQSIPSDSVQGCRKSSSIGASPSKADEPPAQQAKPSSIRISVSELQRILPASADYYGPNCRSWSDLRHVAVRLRRDLGIRHSTWVEATATITDDELTLAVLITHERYCRNEIRLTPGAYFDGLLRKAKKNELDLVRTLWGFRTAGALTQ